MTIDHNFWVFLFSDRLEEKELLYFMYVLYNYVTATCMTSCREYELAYVVKVRPYLVHGSTIE